MSGNLRAQHKAQLKEAYALIKAERRAEAYELIAPVLVQQPDYVDAWWLAAHAAPNLRVAVTACQRVLALKPDHQPARLMLDELRRRMAVEQHLAAEERPRRPRAQSAKSSRLLSRLLILGALIALVLAVVSSAVALTGETFGLPIAQFFNSEQTLPALPLATSVEALSSLPKMTRNSTLPVGARHVYRFNAPRPNIVLQVEVTFRGVESASPRESVRLLLPNGIATPPRNVPEPPNTLSFFLPVSGVYTLELIGTPAAKSFYTLSLLLIDLPSGN
ncbi:MAG: hypothetical protein ACK4P1_02820 [Aggregatilineales bacterium]